MTEDRRRAARRARFADHVESQMRRLGEKEEWRDTRYAELEAELEVFGRRRYSRRSANSLRRVSSLSKALRECPDRLVVLEGEPGAGKSVAMRHLAQTMAYEAMRKPSETSVIPIYVNLKTFRCNGRPTSTDVREFVLASVNSTRERTVEQFLADEFDRGMEEGTWLFLFDSFDEIPDIIGATEANDVIEAYADAVHAFLHSMKTCRGIIASREFRGPGRAAWPTFRVMPLSDKRMTSLVRKADLPVAVEEQLLGELPGAEAGVLQMSRNPLFLGLLCEHMREGNDFPTNVHAVLESFIGHRLARDADRMRGHFDVSSEDVRVVAEELAFLIADHSLGLEVPKPEAVSLLADRLRWPESYLGRALDALVYTKIARTGEDVESVTFSHRRLQEYFATCVVLREPERVPVRTLLTGGRWRETAVTILQTQESGQTAALLAEALALLPRKAVGASADGFDWPPGLLYLLGLLVEGGPVAMPKIQRRIGSVLREAWRTGRHFDRKWVLEVCSAADLETCHELLLAAFKGDSEWLRQEAFAQIRRVPQLAGRLKHEIRKTLLDLSVTGNVYGQRRSLSAHIRRIPDPAPFERALWLLIFGPALYAVVALPMVLVLADLMVDDWRIGFFYMVPAMIFYFVAKLSAARERVSIARLRSLVPWLEFHELIVITAPLAYVFFVYPMVWVASMWFEDRRSFVVGAVVLIVLIVGPSAIFVAVTGAGEFQWRQKIRFVSFWLVPPHVYQVELYLGIALVIAAVWLGGGLFQAALALLVVGSMFLIGALAVYRVYLETSKSLTQRLRVRTARKSISGGVLSAGVLREQLFGLHDVNAVCQIFAAMHLEDVAWSDDVLSYLHRVAHAMEKRNYASKDIPPNTARRQWVSSPDVLDQLSIFLAAQRQKAEAGPR
jgi:hypothetical protein